MLESTLKSLILSSTITDIVGSRVYPILADETAVEPYIVYQVISSVREHTLSGASQLAKARVQISCWTTSYGDSISLKEALRKLLDGYSDLDNPSFVFADLEIQAIFLEDEGDILDFSAGVDKSKHYGKRLDFFVWYIE